MKQESNKRLYFTNDFSPENIKKLQSQGYILRKASAYHEADTLEPCAEVAGEVPQAYIDLIKCTKSNVVVGKVEVGITPELQATIDQAKAECEKVVAENDLLKKQVEACELVEARNSELLSENSRLSDALTQLAGVVAERDALIAKVELLELQVAELKQSNTGASGSLSESNDLFEEKPKDPKAKK